MKADNLNSNRSVLDLGAAAEMRLKARQDPQAGLKQAAQQFEGMLLQMMLKSMRDATPQDGLFDSEQTRFFTSLMDQQVAQNLSSTGTLGFAKLIEQQLARTSAGATGAAVDPAATLEALQRSLLASPAANSAAAARGSVGPAPSAAVLGDGSATAGVSSGTPASPSEFVNRVWPYAVEAGNRLGVPAQFVVAHGALESAWGKSEIRLADGLPSYNLFGVKAGRNWQGPTVDVTTTEYVGGIAQTSVERFRVYGSYGEAFNDYAKLLSGNSRFSSVLGQQDGAGFANSLQQSGYATDPRYADKLSRIIAGGTLRQALAG
jgi:flagellar protein FlgJ